MMAACAGGSSADDPVGKIAITYERGDVRGAARDAERLLADSAAFNSLSAMQLCRLSELFVQLSETESRTDIDANDAMAARCLTRARAIGSDSVAAFLASRSGEMAGRLIVLDQVGTFLDTPRDSLVSSEDLPSDTLQ